MAHFSLRLNGMAGLMQSACRAALVSGLRGSVLHQRTHYIMKCFSTSSSKISSHFSAACRPTLYEGHLFSHDICPKRLFHTTPRRNVPPFIVIILKPLAKAASIVTGRTFRKWWRSLPEERRAYWRSRLAEKRVLLFAGSSVLLLGGLVHYFTHISETPVTHRRRYLAFTHKQFMELAEYEYDVQMKNVEGKIVSPEHPVYKRVINVVQRIVNSNQDFPYMQQQAWTVASGGF